MWKFDELNCSVGGGLLGVVVCIWNRDHWFLVETQLTERTYLKESISSPPASHVTGLGQRIMIAFENVSDHRTTQYYKIR